MSGILKPFVHTTNTINAVDPLHADSIVEATTNTIEVSGTGGKDTYSINFALNRAGNQGVDNVAWLYADATARDTDYAAFIVAFATAL